SRCRRSRSRRRPRAARRRHPPGRRCADRKPCGRARGRGRRGRRLSPRRLSGTARREISLGSWGFCYHTAKATRREKRTMKITRVGGAALLAIALAIAPGAGAKTLRWSSQGDIITMDPHAQNEGFTNAYLDHIYETLVTRGKDLKVIPC